MEQRNTLVKTEKLKSRKAIDLLFAQRIGFIIAPVRVIYSIQPNLEKANIKVGFGSSKKYFKHAVDRNRAKRLMREAYRTQKQSLFLSVENTKQSLHVFFLFSHSELLDYMTMKKVFAVILQRLQGILERTHNKNFDY